MSVRPRTPGSRTAAAVAAGLRAWAAGHPSTVRAAVELLIGHDVWLGRVEFLAAAVHRDPGGCCWIDWTAARRALDGGEFSQAPVVERAVLDLAIALGEDRYRLARMGAGTSRRMAEAVSSAAGLPAPARRDRPPANADVTAPGGGSGTTTDRTLRLVGGSEHSS